MPPHSPQPAQGSDAAPAQGPDAHGHGHAHAHTHPPAIAPAGPTGSGPFSLLMAGVPGRLAGVALGLVLLWSAVAWALGDPA